MINTGKGGKEYLEEGMLDLKGFRLDNVEIAAKLVELKTGEKVFLLSIPGMSEGIAVAQDDIESGAITPQQCYEMVGQAWLKENV